MSNKMQLTKKESVKKPAIQPAPAQQVPVKAVQSVIIAERVQGNYDIALVLSKVKKFI